MKRDGENMRYTNYRFQVPEEKIVRVIVDTDAKNEADDQFAIVQALLSPFWNRTGTGFHGEKLSGAELDF